MTRSSRRPKKADPIFAIIKRLRRAELAVDAAGDDQSPAYDPGNQDLGDKFQRALSAFVRTIPTTPAGVAAFASYLHEAQTRMCHANPYIDEVNDAEAFAATLNLAVSRALGFQPWPVRS
jgi:hypothetical protein